MDKTIVSVPVEPTEAMLKAAHAAMLSDIPPDGESTYGPTISTHAIYRAYWAAMLSAAPAPQPVQGEAVSAERFDFVDPALVVPWLAVIYSEFLPDEDNLGRRSDIEMRAALDYAMKFVAGHRQCQPDWFQKQALEAYSLLAAEGWEWNAQHGWTRPPIAAPDHIADARKMVAAPGDVEQRALAILAATMGRTPEQMGYAEPDAYVSETDAIHAISAALRSQGQAVAVDAKDAARYRWLRAYYGSANFDPIDHDGMDLVFSVPQGEVSANCDKTIDGLAALAQQANKEQPPNG